MVSSNFVNMSTKVNGIPSHQALLQNAQELCNTATANLPYRYGQKVINNDTVEINNTIDNAKEKIKESIDKEQVKKVSKIGFSVVAALALAFGVTKGVNKNINKFWQIGEKVDTVVKNSKLCNSINKGIKTLAEKNPLKKSKLFNDICNLTKSENRMQPKSMWAKMSVLGPKGIFSLTASEVLTNTAKAVGDKGKFIKYLESLVGKDAKICGKTVQQMAEACFNGGDLGESFKFSKELMQAVKNKHGLKSSSDMLKFFDNLKVGKIGNETFEFAKDVKMRGWLPGSKGNLGETMKKYAIMNGQAAQTKAGQVIQQVPLILGESIGNCINDRSTFGAMITLTSLPTVFNEAQEAPKGKKAKTVVAQLISEAASWAVGMAGAGAIIYSIASLRNLKSAGKIANILKKTGKVASMGLQADSKKPAKIVGGALRLGAVMSLSGKITTPIDNTIKKSFGLPTRTEKEAMEELKAKQEQALAQAQQMQALQYASGTASRNALDAFNM